MSVKISGNKVDWWSKMKKMDRQERLERTASMANNKGLLNNPGENNCFLNSAVQVGITFCFLSKCCIVKRSVFREHSFHFLFYKGSS